MHVCVAQEQTQEFMGAYQILCHFPSSHHQLMSDLLYGCNMSTI